MARKLIVELIGDSSSLDRSLRRANRSLNHFGRESSRATRGAAAGSGLFRGFGRSVAFASTAFLGGYGLTYGLHSAFEEMVDMEKQSAQTNAAIKSTGGVANVTAEHVDELAKSMMNLSGINDEVVKSGENILLTFTKIRNEVGAGNNIFDQAVQAATDLSVRFGTDLPTASKQLGKALQDPIRGVTALRRVGVSFDDAQKKVIKRLVESGHLLEAQKIVLKELRVEVGGSARALGDTLGGKLNILRENVRNLAGEIATELSPAIKRLVDRATAWVQNADNQKRVMKDVKDVAEVVADVFRTLNHIWQTFAKITGGTKNALKLLIAMFVTIKSLQLIGWAGRMATNFGLLATSAKGATAETRALGLSMGALGEIGAIIFTITILIENKNEIENWFDKHITGGYHIKPLGSYIKEGFRHFFGDAKSAGEKAGEAYAASFKAGVQKGGDRPDPLARARGPFFAVPGLGAPVGGRRGGRDGLLGPPPTFEDQIGRMLDRVQDASLTRQLRTLRRIESILRDRISHARTIRGRLKLEDRLWDIIRQEKGVRQQIFQGALDSLQLGVDRAGLTAGLEDDIRALRRLEAAIKRRIAIVGHTVELESQLIQTQGEILGKKQEQADRRREAIQRRNEANRRRREAAARRRETAQYRALGLGPGGEELIPGIGRLRQQLRAIRGAIAGSELDKPGTWRLIDNMQRILAGKLGKVGPTIRAQIRDMIKSWREALKGDQGGGTWATWEARGTDTLLRGLGLNPRQIDTLRQRISQIGPHGIAPHGRTVGFAGAGMGMTGGVYVAGDVHVHGVTNVKELEHALAKRRHARPYTRRGAH